MTNIFSDGLVQPPTRVTWFQSFLFSCLFPPREDDSHFDVYQVIDPQRDRTTDPFVGGHLFGPEKGRDHSITHFGGKSNLMQIHAAITTTTTTTPPPPPPHSSSSSSSSSSSCSCCCCCCCCCHNDCSYCLWVWKTMHTSSPGPDHVGDSRPATKHKGGGQPIYATGLSRAPFRPAVNGQSKREGIVCVGVIFCDTYKTVRYQVFTIPLKRSDNKKIVRCIR